MQSRLVGPLYLTNIALPSLTSAIIDDKLNTIDYNHDLAWFETHANRMSYQYFTYYEPNALSEEGLEWNYKKYPQKHNQTWYDFSLHLIFGYYFY